VHSVPGVVDYTYENAAEAVEGIRNCNPEVNDNSCLYPVMKVCRSADEVREYLENNAGPKSTRNVNTFVFSLNRFLKICLVDNFIDSIFTSNYSYITKYIHKKRSYVLYCLFLFYLDRTYSSSEEEQSLDTQKREKFKFYLFILEPTTRRPERR